MKLSLINCDGFFFFDNIGWSSVVINLNYNSRLFIIIIFLSIIFRNTSFFFIKKKKLVLLQDC